MNNPTHELTREELMAYLDGESTLDRASQAAKHLEGCLECRQAANEFRELSQRLSIWQVEERAEEALPSSLAQALEVAKESSQRGAPRPHWWNLRSRPVAVTALCAMTVTGVVIVALQMTRAPSMPSPFSERRSMLVAPPAPRTHGFTGPAAATRRVAEATTVSALEARSQPAAVEPGRAASPPLLARTAELTLRVESLDRARGGLEALVARRQGYIGSLDLSSAGEPSRELQAAVMVPTQALESILNDLRSLGRVEEESQRAEDVTRQSVDLDARLENSRVTEQRLLSLLRVQTAKLSDVLEAEEQISRVRAAIEQMQSERRELGNRVVFATVSLTVHEDVRAVPPAKYSTAERLKRAASTGWHSFLESLLDMTAFLLTVGPALLFWGGLAAGVGWLIWRRQRQARRAS